MAQPDRKHKEEDSLMCGLVEKLRGEAVTVKQKTKTSFEDAATNK